MRTSDKIVIETVTAEHSQAVIASQNALVKSVRSSAHNFRHWLYLLQQIKDPSSYRPVQMAEDEQELDRNHVYDAEQKKWVQRYISDRERSRPKEGAIYTKKTSTSYLPPDADIKIFEHSIGENIGLIFDLRDCDIKDKYIFENNINSRNKPWIKRAIYNRPDHPLINISLDNLRAKYRPSGPIPILGARLPGGLQQVFEHSEILAGLSKQSVIGTFASKDLLIERLAALTMHAFVYDILGKEVPVFIVDTINGVRHYTRREQLSDFKAALQLPKTHPARLYADVYFDLVNPELRELLQTTPAEKPAINLPELNNDVISVLSENFDYHELWRLRTLYMQRQMKEPAFMRALTEQAYKKDAPLENIADERPHQEKLEKAIKCGAFYRDHKNDIDYYINYINTHNPDYAIRCCLSIIREHKYLSPLLKSFINHDILNKMANDEFNEFSSEFIHFANQDNIEHLFNRRVGNIEETQNRVVIFKDVKRSSGWDSYYRKEQIDETKVLNLLANAALFNPTICSLLLKHNPNLFEPALEAMQQLNKFAKEYGNSNKYFWMIDYRCAVTGHFNGEHTIATLTSETVEKAQLHLLGLANLIDNNNLKHDYTYQEKRLLERHFLERIASTKNQAELTARHDELKQLPCMSARRHPVADSIHAFLFKPKQTRLEREVEKEVVLKKLSFGTG